MGRRRPSGMFPQVLDAEHLFTVEHLGENVRHNTHSTGGKHSTTNDTRSV